MHSSSSAQYLPQIATITSPVLSTCNRSANSRLVGNSYLIALCQSCPSSVILAIGGVFTRVLAKHSKSFSFIDCISVGVDRMQQSFESFWKPGSRSRSRPGAVSTAFTQSGYAMTRNSGPATLPPAG